MTPRIYSEKKIKDMRKRLEELDQLEKTGYRGMPERKIIPRRIGLYILKELNQIYN